MAKRCPFCGSEPYLMKFDEDLYSYACDTKDCKTYGPNGKTPELAELKWNCRRLVDIEVGKKLEKSKQQD